MKSRPGAVYSKTMDAKQFYAKKLQLLKALQAKVNEAKDLLSDLSDHEDHAADPDFDEFYQLAFDLDNTNEEISGLLMAVYPLADQ